jgi:iron complex transport system substrate-binding protein
MKLCRSLRLLVACLAVVASACAHTSAAQPAGSASALPTTFPVTIASASASVTIPHRPDRIVSLSPTLTEDLFAEGAGPQVVAVDNQSDYPPGAPVTALSGYTPNVEAIAGYRPDLVVISDDTNGLSASLTKLGIPTLLEPAANTLNEVYAEMDQLGEATGHLAAAEALAESTRTRVQALVAQAPKHTPAPTYFYELDPTLYTATSKTFVGSLFSLLGMKNIADRYGSVSAGGYPQLNAEALLQADPDYIFLADTICCQQSPASVARRPGYGALAAVKDHHVIPLNDDVASRWGPRVTVLLSDIVAALEGGSPSPAPS